MGLRFGAVAAAVAAVVLVAMLLETSFAQNDPSYDHQTTTYYAKFAPQEASSASLSITSYFSPDHSIDTQTSLIQSAQNSIDLGIPGFSSWSGCTNFSDVDGCPVGYLRQNEAFPIFHALLNAIHRGVTVRILTNDYNTGIVPGYIDPLDFLTVAGAQTRYYTTTSFLHSKYMAVDGKTASISSVNFSYTSFMKNREAGVLISGPAAGPLLNYLDQVFSYDFAQGGQWPVPSYNASDLAIINDKTPDPVVVPPPVNFPGAYVTSVQTVTATFDEVSLISSPDYSWSTISGAINQTQNSLSIYVYQITGSDFCDTIANLYNNGVTLKILVSDRIYDKDDWKAATQCYEQLYDLGVTIRKTAYDMYTYSHQKFWIIDGQTLFLSTGNMSPSDYPDGAGIYPPYGNANWRKLNRDFTIMVQNPTMVQNFQTVLDADYELGHDFYPPRTLASSF